MLDFVTVFDLLRAAAGVAVAAAAAVLAVWLWKETRRPASLFTEPESEPTRFDRLTDRAATLVGSSIHDHPGDQPVANRHDVETDHLDFRPE